MKTTAPLSSSKTSSSCDIFIIGGGINGCGVARELAGRGYDVHLCEMRDLSSGTSSWSTKLIHGGLRYLEYYEFQLVRKALKEREVLMKMAPHLIHPLRFVLPHVPSSRPKWLLRAGLFLYDFLGPRKILPASSSVDFKTDISGALLKPHYQSGFEYSDCMVDDNRLTILNARAAADEGAVIETYTKVENITRSDGLWQVETDKAVITAKMVINAGGPWADQIRGLVQTSTPRPNHNKASIRLVRGSHIITDKLYDHDKAYIFQNSDGRILFVIPYLDEFTLIGTTDVDHDEAPDNPEISDDEISYICREVSAYLKTDITEKDVRHSYSGVRPLFDDGAADAKAATRDYVLSFEEGTDNQILNILGGKLTTYRQLALQVAAKIQDVLPAPSHKVIGTKALPGGDIKDAHFDAFLTRLKSEFPDMDRRYLRRLALAYGTEIYQILGTAEQPQSQGIDFGLGLRQAEVDFLMAHEWARTPEDVLMRRTKLGYHATDDIRGVLADYMARTKA